MPAANSPGPGAAGSTSPRRIRRESMAGLMPAAAASSSRESHISPPDDPLTIDTRRVLRDLVAMPLPSRRPVGRHGGGTSERLVGFPLRRARPLRHHDPPHRVEIAAAAVAAGEPAAAGPNAPALPGAGRPGEGGRPLGRL